METPERPKIPRPPRWLVMAWVSFAAVVWTAWLVASELDGGEGYYALAVKILGSAGILHLLFLVFRRPTSFEERPADEEADQAGLASEPEIESGARARWTLISLILVLVFGAVLYRLAQDSYLHSTSAFFIGVPSVIAIALTFAPRSGSATGLILRGITIAMLLSGIVLGEGLICVLMASPLFYVVGIGIGQGIDRVQRDRGNEGRLYSIVGIAVLLMSAEGVTPATTLPTQQSVTVTRTIDASTSSVRGALAKPPRFDAELPIYLKLGFPQPRRAMGRGIEGGDGRVIFFGNESPMEPMGAGHHQGHHGQAPKGAITFRIAASEPGRIVFEVVDDQTAFTHWVEWGRSIVEWHASGDDRTTVTWTVEFERKLSPAWYFGPWQRYAGRLAADYLIDTAATP